MQYRSLMSLLTLPGFLSLVLVVIPRLATADDTTAEDEEAFRALDLTEDDYLSGKEAKSVLQYDQDGDKRVTKAEFLELMAGPGGGGFVYAGWCGDPACEEAIKAETKATIRVLLDEEFRSPEAPATCLWCGRPSQSEAVWAKAY